MDTRMAHNSRCYPMLTGFSPFSMPGLGELRQQDCSVLSAKEFIHLANLPQTQVSSLWCWPSMHIESHHFSSQCIEYISPLFYQQL